MKNIQRLTTQASFLKRNLLLILILPVFSTFLFSSTTVNAQLISINPNIGQQGQTLTTLITASGTQFQSSSPNGNIYDIQLQKPGFTTIHPDTSTINIIDNTHFNVDVSIPSNAAKGLYNLVVTVAPGTDLTLANAFRVGTPDGTVSGTVYYDANGNGVKDGVEPPLADEKILITPDSTYITTDALGNYSLDTYNGSRTIEWKVTNQHYYLLSSANASYTVVINNNNSSGNDFGLKSAIISVVPDQANAGQTLTTTITGDDIFLQNSSPAGNIYNFYLPGVLNFNAPASGYNVIDSSNATVHFTVDGNAVPGIYDVNLTVESLVFPFDYITYILPDGFTIGAPDGYVSGIVYYDSNNNGVKDAGEPPLENEKILITPDSIYTTTDALGNYSIGSSNGSHTVEWKVTNQHYFLLSSANASYAVVINNNNLSGNDFGLKSVIISIVPNQGNAGQTLTTTITGDDIFLQNSSPAGNIYNFYFPEIPNFSAPSSGYNVIDSSNAEITFVVDGSVSPGVYDVALTVVSLVFPFDYLTYILPDGFTIGAPDGYVSGTIYFDADTNGVRDPGEFGVQYTNLLLTPENSLIHPDVSGNYNYGIANGSHTVAMNMSSLDQFILSSPDTFYNFTSNNNTTSGLDFGIKSHIYSISPNQSYQGQTLTTTITGFEVEFQSSSPGGDIYEMNFYKSGGGFSIPVPLSGIIVTDPTHFDALVTIPSIADTGYYDVSVVVMDSVFSWIHYTHILPHGFHVTNGNVWPGDANYDLVANNTDVLNIGLAYGETGPVRTGASLSWVAQPALNWSGYFQNGVNKKHADCDGNGIVDNNDTLAISLNYGLTHPARLTNPDQNLSSPPLYIVTNPHSVAEGDTIEMDFFLGNSSIPVDSIYGIAFTMNFDTALVDTSYMPFDYSGCWMGTPGGDLLTYTHKLFSQGKVDIALVRTDHLNQSGYGLVGRAGVVIVDNIGAKLSDSTTLVNALFTISNVKAITASEFYLTVSTNGDQVAVDSSDNLNQVISVYPNPVSNVLTINSGSGKINSLEIYNNIGQLMTNKKPSASIINLNVQSLNQGIYLLKLTTDADVVNRKISIVRK